MHIEKSKISKNHSFIMKSSVLEKALEQADIRMDVILYHMNGGIFFDAYYFPSSANFENGRLIVRAGNVPSGVAHAARIYVETSVVPALITWIEGIVALNAHGSGLRDKQEFWQSRLPQFDLRP